MADTSVTGILVAAFLGHSLITAILARGAHLVREQAHCPASGPLSYS